MGIKNIQGNLCLDGTLTLAGDAPVVTLGEATLDEAQLKALLKLLETGVNTYANGDEEEY